MSFRPSAAPDKSRMLTRRARSFVWLAQPASVVHNPTTLTRFRRAV